MSGNVDLNVRPDADEILRKIADYSLNAKIDSEQALYTDR